MQMLQKTILQISISIYIYYILGSDSLINVGRYNNMLYVFNLFFIMCATW